jgi:uncharacterized protein YjbI with pentapeptide repeats
MANPEHLAILKKGVVAWNNWRAQNIKTMPDLGEANLRDEDLSGIRLDGADLSGANLIRTTLMEANLRGAELSGAVMTEAYLPEADLSGAELRKTDLFRAYLRGANLHGADLWQANLREVDLTCSDLRKANLSEANLSKANLSEAHLSEADLSAAILVKTDFSSATLNGCKIYGVAVWDLKLENAKQNGLIISQEDQPVITVDNMEVAQFIYLLLNNQKIRNVIDAVANKAVLILGRFRKRKVVLDSIADELRKRDYLPIMFDFDRPLDKNLTETVITLAGLCKFVIAVMSDPQSVPWEVASIKQVFKIPIVPLCQEGQGVFSMYNDEKINPWYLPPIPYKDVDHIKQIMDAQILEPAEKKHLELRELKAK